VRRQHSHRGTFIADSKLPTCDLVKQVRDAIGDDVTIAAAGGIVNGADVRAVLDKWCVMMQCGVDS
jgi:NAD(P)H-dependent flavin oxidoreductase YrpB (nitropropane dioxygenase family)